MERLKISDDKRYFVRDGNAPFIWIGDTAWTMPQRMKWDDVEYYLQKRKSQGFTVLQIVALDPERDVQMRNPAGIKALREDDPMQPEEEYFKYLDWILKRAEEYGFYVLLLPVWGQLVTGDNWANEIFEKTVTEENAHFYGKWIGSRYRNQKNIIWCLGGDRMPLHKGTDYQKVWRRLAEGLAEGVTGRALKYNQDAALWKEILITYHACHEMETGKCSTMSYWTKEEAWIQFIMIQSGHGLEPQNYQLIQQEYERAETMPVWDGEPAYEKMPTSWPVIKEYHGSWIVRKRAYWSLFAGAFGHTYGHASVWCSISEKEKNHFADITWYQALDAEGASQIKILRDFLETVDLSTCVPAQELLLQENEAVMDEHIQVTRQRDGSFLCAYLPSGGSCKLDTGSLNGDNLYCWWFNPRDGKCYDSSGREQESPTKVAASNHQLLAEAPAKGAYLDWIFVLSTQEDTLPVLCRQYGITDAPTEEKKVFQW